MLASVQPFKRPKTTKRADSAVATVTEETAIFQQFEVCTSAKICSFWIEFRFETMFND